MHGSFTMLHLTVGDEATVVDVRAERWVDYPLDAPVRFDIDPDSVRFFDPADREGAQTRWGAMSNVALQNITKRFKTVTALRDVSFDIKHGEFFVLLGPTGAGKTTTLRVIAGLEQQTEGRVSFDGQRG